MRAPARRTLLAVLAALAFAVSAFVSGADRYSQYQPAATRFVPQFLMAHSATAEAARALLEGDLDRSSRFASVATRADPLDSTSLSIRGAAQLALREQAQSRRSFAAAAKLGHRDPLVESYWFAEELARGDAQAAAKHLDALLRAHPDFAPAQDFLTLLEASPEGRAALARRLAENSYWADIYISAKSMETPALRSRATYLASVSAGSPAIGCERIRPMVRELAVRGYRGEAERLEAAQCGTAAKAGPVADADFEAFVAEATEPFGWRRHATGDVRISRLGGDRARVELDNRSSVTRLVLSQPVNLARGTYRIRVKVDGPGGQRLAASLDCGSPLRPALRRERIDREGWTLASQGCDDALLGLWLRPGSGRIVLDRVDLVPD